MIKTKNYFLLIISIFSILLIFYNILNPKILASDVEQYITSAKEFAGVSHSKIHNPHSFVYPLFLSLFLKINNSLLMLKITNLIWLILIGIILYNYSKDIKSLIIWASSPIVWYMGAWISPVLPVTFFLLLAYIFLKKWEYNKKNYYLILSGMFLGLTAILWDGIIPSTILFIIIFFFNKELKESLIYGLAYLFSFSIRLIVDYIYFNFPLYSLIRFFGAVLVILIGANKIIKPYSTTEFIWIPLIITPLLFLIYKIDYKKYKKELIFLILTTISFTLMGEIRYLLIISPIIILMIKDLFKKKQMYLHMILSIIIILILVYPFLTYDYDKNVQKDLIEINNEFKENMITGNPELPSYAVVINSLYFGNNIKEFIWWEDYEINKKNQTSFYTYEFESDPKIRDVRKLKITGSLQTTGINSTNIKYLLIDKNYKSVKPFTKLNKCYRILCIYENSNSNSNI